MTAIFRSRRAVRAAGLVPFAVAALASPGADAAADGVLLPPESQQIDATVRSTCTTVSGPTVASVPTRTIDVQLRGSLPLSATAGSKFTFDGLTARFVIGPTVIRPQVVGTRGSLGVQLDDLALQADGGSPNPAQVVSPKAPTDLGTEPLKIATAPAFDAPLGAPKATFDPVGPWAIAEDAGGVAVGLRPFALTLTYYPQPTPTTKFAPSIIKVACTPQSPWFAKFPVSPPAQPAPTITGLSPNIGGAGTLVKISGTGLLGVTSVDFGGTPVAFKLGSDTELQAVAPTINWIIAPPPTLQWDVSVSSAAGTSANTPSDDFTYLTGTPFGPAITSLTPSIVAFPGGKLISVLGRGFKGATTVTVGKVPAKFGVFSDGRLAFQAPVQQRPGSYPVQIETPAGTATSTLTYAVSAS